MNCEITIRSDLGVLVHTIEEHVSTLEAVRSVLSRPDVQERVGTLKYAGLAVLCRVVGYAAEGQMEGRAAA